jgi:enoyl-[acyl-carrier protein] reductase I
MGSDFLGIANKTFVVFGAANRRSIAVAVARTLQEAGARVIHVVQNAEIAGQVQALFGDTPVLTCDVRDEKAIAEVATQVGAITPKIDGLIHSLAFARYSQGFVPFEQTPREDFLEAVDVSCYSLISIARHFQPLLSETASLVTLSISDTRMAAENYGYMGPVKAALDSTIAFLAKSLSRYGEIRVNAVGAGLLKTSASAGIPGYIESYLFAEQAIPRKRGLTTQEVANTVVFLLSPRAAGINAQTIVVDAGMGTNFFDRDIVKRVNRADGGDC